MPIAMIAKVSSTTNGAAVLWKNEIFSVRIIWTIKVCDSRPSTNQPDWNRDWLAMLSAPKTCHMTR